MTSCNKCNSQRTQAKPLTDIDLADLGIPVRVSNGAQVVRCEDCGEEETVIENPTQLVRVAAFHLVFAPYRLNHLEVRFCRKTAGMSGKSLAERLSIQPETVSRWENGKQQISDAIERIFRQWVYVLLRDKDPWLSDEGYQIGTETILTLDLSPIRKPEDVPLLSYEKRALCKKKSREDFGACAESPRYFLKTGS